MSSSKSILSALIEVVAKMLSTPSRTGAGTSRGRSRPRATMRPPQGERTGSEEVVTPGRDGSTATVRVDPNSVPGVDVGYSPSRNDVPDSGEVIWTWVPYEENDGRGKDRPVLVIGRESAQRVYAVRMTSKAHDGDRDYIPIGSGAWDSRGRDSWVDIEQLYSVHHEGMRREASVLDRARYGQVANALISRYGWARE